MTPSQQILLRLSPADYAVLLVLATAEGVTVQRLISDVLGKYASERGYTLEGIRERGNPNWTALNQNRCICTAADCADDGIVCRKCGKPLG